MSSTAADLADFMVFEDYDVTDDEKCDKSGFRNSLSIPPSIRNSGIQFDPQYITRLDLENFPELRQHAFETGRLPKWICHFVNLTSLNANKLNIVVLEPWLLELTSLRSLFLAHNQIRTWPAFLRQMPKLKIIRLDGNPCLEKAFLKSPTLRSKFFNWNPSNELCRVVSDHIRGHEWTPASHARAKSLLLNASIFGFYCGGIYALDFEPDDGNDDLLTPLEPDPLMSRLMKPPRDSLGERPKSIVRHSKTLSTYSSYKSNYHLRSQAPGLKETQIYLEIFDDITTLQMRETFPLPKNKKTFTLLIGSPKDSVNQLLHPTVRTSRAISLGDMYMYAQQLVREEEEFLQEMELIRKQFFEAKTSSPNISDCLRNIFAGFPAMLNIHKEVLKYLRRMLGHVQKLYEFYATSYKYDKTSLQYIKFKKHIRNKACQAAIDLCGPFRRLETAFNLYATNLCLAEQLLDLPGGAARIYEDPKFASAIKSQSKKLGLMNSSSLMSHIPETLSLNLSSAGWRRPFRSTQTSPVSQTMRKSDYFAPPSAPPSPSIASRASTPFKMRSGKTRCLNDWVDKQLHKPIPTLTRRPQDCLYLPLWRLVRYERFFESFSRVNQHFMPVSKVLRTIRRAVAIEVQRGRLIVRKLVLANKFRTLEQAFEEYKWDAILCVKSRGYFEHGILAKDTNDVIDFNGKSMSFVKEVFKFGVRVLRLVCCGCEIQIWDEILEQYVGKCDKSSLIVIPKSSTAQRNEVRLVFVKAMETCLVEVKEFKATYATKGDHYNEFIEACQCDFKKIV